MFPFSFLSIHFIRVVWLLKFIKLLICIQVATGQVASTGMVLLSYVQKVSEKVSTSSHCRFVLSVVLFISHMKCSLQVSLAADLMCNYLSRDVTASFGYDYILRQVVFSFMNLAMETSTTWMWMCGDVYIRHNWALNGIIGSTVRVAVMWHEWHIKFALIEYETLHCSHLIWVHQRETCCNWKCGANIDFVSFSTLHWI